MKKITVKPSNVGQRLDKFLTDKLKISRSQVQKLIKRGAVLIDDKIASAHQTLKENKIVEIQTLHTPTTQTPTILPNFKLKIIHLNRHYLIINKPAGIPVHPDPKHQKETLIQKITAKYPAIKKIGDSPVRPGVVHRLDKKVSGLLVVTRTQEMFECLKKQFQQRRIKKEYIALIHGKINPEIGEIDFLITRGQQGIMAARPKNQTGKVAITQYQVLKYFINYSLVKVIIKTGRSHQIRVHFKALGHPVVGDRLYTIRKQKPDKVPLDRLFLHAQTLGFKDLNNKWQEFRVDLPAELEDYLKNLKS